MPLRCLFVLVAAALPLSIASVSTDGDSLSAPFLGLNFLSLLGEAGEAALDSTPDDGEGAFLAAVNGLSADPALSLPPSDIISGILDRLEANAPPKKMAWNWEEAVLVHAAAQAALITDSASPNRERLTRVVEQYQQGWLGSKRQLPSINRGDMCPSAMAPLDVAQLRSTAVDPKAMAKLVNPVLDYLKNAPRNKLGALDHLGSSWFRAVFPESIWLDSLLMTGVTAVRFGTLLGDAELIDWGATQPAIYASVLEDKRDHLYRHAWLVGFERSLPDSDTYWLRGNSWVLWALTEMLSLLPPDHTQRPSLLASLERFSAALLAHQGPAGLWDSVLNLRDYAGDETSGSAIIAAHWLKAVRLNLLPRDPYQTAALAVWRGLQPRIVKAARGVPGLSVRGISGPTNPGFRKLYSLVPERVDAHYGVGPVLMLAAEVAALPSLKAERAVNI